MSHNMRIKIKLSWPKAVIVTLCFILMLNNSFYVVYAAESQPALAVSPSVIETKIDKGESQSKKIDILNNSTKPLILKAYVENFTATDEFGGISFNSDGGSAGAAKDMIVLDQENLSIDSLEKTELGFTIKAANDASPGGYYAAIFLERDNNIIDSNNTNLEVSQRIGVLLFINVNGDINESGQIVGAKANSTCEGNQCSFKTNDFFWSGPIPFEFKFENTGNVHLKVSGKITVYDLFNKKVGEIPVNEKTVLPNKTRNFKATWQEKSLFGYYTAKLQVESGSNKIIKTAHKKFYVIPREGLLLIILPIGLLLGLYYRHRRKNKNKKSKNVIQKNLTKNK